MSVGRDNGGEWWVYLVREEGRAQWAEGSRWGQIQLDKGCHHVVMRNHSWS